MGATVNYYFIFVLSLFFSLYITLLIVSHDKLHNKVIINNYLLKINNYCIT